MKRKTNRALIFILINLALVSAVVFVGLYKKFSADTGADPLGLCVMHDVLRLYCPGCGGTRAVMLLAGLDIVGSFMCNPIVPCFAGIYLYLAIRAAVSIMRDSEKVIYWNNALTWISAGLPIAVFVIRNILLVFFGVDTIGDLGAY